MDSDILAEKIAWKVFSKILWLIGFLALVYYLPWVAGVITALLVSIVIFRKFPRAAAVIVLTSVLVGGLFIAYISRERGTPADLESDEPDLKVDTEYLLNPRSTPSIANPSKDLIRDPGFNINEGRRMYPLTKGPDLNRTFRESQEEIPPLE